MHFLGAGLRALTCDRPLCCDALILISSVQRATTPMSDLRPDAPKEQLRLRDQDALPLVRVKEEAAWRRSISCDT